MSIAPAGEVRLGPCKFVATSAWMALDLLSRRLGSSKAPQHGTSGLPHAFRHLILVGAGCKWGMSATMIEESLRWIGMVAAIVTASIVAARLSDRATGLGFVVFLVSSSSWVAVGLMAGEYALMIQNAFLCAVNLLGIYRWLLQPAIAGKTARR